MAGLQGIFFGTGFPGGLRGDLRTPQEEHGGGAWCTFYIEHGVRPFRGRRGVLLRTKDVLVSTWELAKAICPTPTRFQEAHLAKKNGNVSGSMWGLISLELWLLCVLRAVLRSALLSVRTDGQFRVFHSFPLLIKAEKSRKASHDMAGRCGNGHSTLPA